MRVIEYDFQMHGVFEEEHLEIADSILKDINDVKQAISDGRAYAKIKCGDRAGSVAKIEFDPDYKPTTPSIERRITWGRSNKQISSYYLGNLASYVVLKWTNRKNRVKETIPSSDIDVLIVEDGETIETIYEKFDTKAAKAKLLENPDQKDINGNVLSVGDRVLYINARYGNRMVLSEGVIVEFLVSVNSYGHTFATLIESSTGETSSLQYPESMVFKMP